MWAEPRPGRRRLAIAAAALTVTGDAPAAAGDVPESAPTLAAVAPAGGADLVASYPADFFSEFRPATALDMIGRIPAFSYNRGNAGLRGLAGAGGNILIDGQRPSTKSLSLDDVIRRIPDSNVIRIDVLRGGPGIDMQGHSLVANVVRDPGGATLFTGEVLTKLYTDHAPARMLRLEALRTRGALSLEGAVHYRDERDQGVSGRGRLIRRDDADRVVESGAFEAGWDRALYQANGAAEYRAGPDFVRLAPEWRDERRLSGHGATRGQHRGLLG